ncbi:MAG: hypothetical protein Q4F67_17630 [Propionibacteriaceae bacterium]|nr:hypothetical protein [Propionibacteriaceae bacterium]
MSHSNVSGPRLVADGVVLLSLLDVAAPELVSVLEPMPAKDRPDALVCWFGTGAPLAARMDAIGETPDKAREALADALDVARAAWKHLPPSTRARLDWPPEAERLTVPGWLAAYAKDPARWLLDLAGGLPPATLLRTCLLARPHSWVELWLPGHAYGPARVHRAEPLPAPVDAASAREFLLLRGDRTEPMQQRGQQP